MLFRRANSIAPADAAERVSSGALQLVDVREQKELAECRVRAARHIPLDELGRRLDELDRSKPVAFLCRSGARSAMAARVAEGRGFTALNVKGGVIEWQRRRLPVEGGAA